MRLLNVGMAPVVQGKRVSCYSRISGPYPNLRGSYSLNALTSASEAPGGDHLEDEVRGDRSARASAERDAPMASADMPQLVPRAHFLPSSRKGEGRGSAPGSPMEPLGEGSWEALGEAWPTTLVHVSFREKGPPRPPYLPGET